MSRTLVIAEPGCTHEGSLDRMKDLIGVAKSCGADVFKNQWVSDVDAMVARRHGEDYRRFYQWLNYPASWHQQLRAYCDALGMQYACSIYLGRDAATVGPHVAFLKISSFEALDEDFVLLAERSGELVISTGMQGQQLPWSTHGHKVLHCVSAYPCPLNALNLNVLSVDCCDTRPRFDGLSDHSRNVLTGAVAVGAGAQIIEAHFRLDDCDPGNPDYAVAFSPAEFRQYIQNIRDAELMMGDGIKKIEPCEEAMLKHRVTA